MVSERATQCSSQGFTRTLIKYFIIASFGEELRIRFIRNFWSPVSCCMFVTMWEILHEGVVDKM